MMNAKKRPFNRTSNYLVTLDPKKLEINTPGYVAKLRSNFIGSEYHLFDTGVNPSKNPIDTHQLRNELCAVRYVDQLSEANNI